jgi:hypothetical protein
VVTNLLGLALIMAAYNSKESAWGLIPSTVILGVLHEAFHGGTKAGHLGRLWYGTRAVAGMLWLPSGYAVFHVVASLLQLMGGAEHALGGSPLVNLGNYVGYLLNWRGGDWYLPFALGACAVATLAAYFTRWPAYLIIWGWLSLALSLVIPSMAKGAAPYYMTVPSFFFWISLALVASWTIDTARNGTLRMVATSGLAGALGLYLVSFAGLRAENLQIARWSDNWFQTLSRFAAEVPADRPVEVRIAYPAASPLAYMFFAGNPQPALHKFVYGPDAPSLWLDKHLTSATYASDPQEAVDPSRVNLVLGPDLSVLQIIKPGP